MELNRYTGDVEVLVNHYADVALGCYMMVERYSSVAEMSADRYTGLGCIRSLRNDSVVLYARCVLAWLEIFYSLKPTVFI